MILGQKLQKKVSKKIEILYEDDLCLVINKPAGLAVQGGVGINTSLDKILSEIRSPAPLLVHRLDRDTSGVILTAKSKDAAALFSKYLGENTNTKKYYNAICLNNKSFSCKEGVINFDLQYKDEQKKAITKYKVLSNGKIETGNGIINFTFLELELGTGRMHQIRRHLAMNGSPILSDDKYGDFKLNRNLKKIINLKKLLLHSKRLIIKELNIDITAPLPFYFLDVLDISHEKHENLRKSLYFFQILLENF